MIKVTKPMKPLAWARWASALLAVAACSSDPAAISSTQAAEGANDASPGAEATTDAAGDDGANACVGDEPYSPATIAPNLTVQGSEGAFSFVLVSASPTPPVLEFNTWILKLIDASGHPVTD